MTETTTTTDPKAKAKADAPAPVREILRYDVTLKKGLSYRDPAIHFNRLTAGRVYEFPNTPANAKAIEHILGEGALNARPVYADGFGPDAEGEAAIAKVADIQAQAEARIAQVEAEAQERIKAAEKAAEDRIKEIEAQAAKAAADNEKKK